MNEAAGQEMTVADYFRQQVSGRRLMCMHARACKCARSLSPRAPPACPPPNLPSRPPSRAPHPPTPHCVQYNISLKNHELPCVAVGNGKVLLPPELCIIAPGQVGGCGWLCGVRALPSPPTAHTPQPSSRLPPPPPLSMQRRSKLTEMQTAEMIKTSAQVGRPSLLRSRCLCAAARRLTPPQTPPQPPLGSAPTTRPATWMAWWPTRCECV